MRRIAPSLLLVALLVGCGGPSAARRAEVSAWLKAIRERGRQGDWLVLAGTHAGDRVVSTATMSELTHAGILDLQRGEVVEAVSPQVRAVPMKRFIADAQRVQLIHPTRWSIEAGVSAVERARGKRGAGYDFLGTIGLPSQKRFYCTELVVWAYRIEVDRKGPHRVLHPRSMQRYGTVIFDTGKSQWR